MVIASLAGRFSMENYLKKCFFRGYSEPVKLLDTLAVPPPYWRSGMAKQRPMAKTLKSPRALDLDC